MNKEKIRRLEDTAIARFLDKNDMSYLEIFCDYLTEEELSLYDKLFFDEYEECFYCENTDKENCRFCQERKQTNEI